MLRQGVCVALGTDSRASNPDLNLWEELRFVARRHPALSPATVLHLGTQGGAAALGLDDECGAIVPGRRADLATVSLPPTAADDPHELLFDNDAVAKGVCSGQ
jgi:cytosine/adenosine deaminase-related metal-dependent hydrolase